MVDAQAICELEMVLDSNIFNKILAGISETPKKRGREVLAAVITQKGLEEKYGYA